MGDGHLVGFAHFLVAKSGWMVGWLDGRLVG